MTGYLLNSSNLYSADYEPWRGTFTIAFRSGGVYEYYGVPASVYAGLLRADSPGRFHHQYIKHHYSYRHLA